MKRNIRQKAFETNSSSMHSLTIDDTGFLNQTLHVNDEGELHIYTGEFGWEIEDHNDAATKASYIATFLMGLTPGSNKWYGKPYETRTSEELKFMFHKVLTDQTLAKRIVINDNYNLFTEIKDEDEDDEEGFHSYEDFGYIDHQSFDLSIDAFDSEETLRQFIFSSNSVLHTDNDNH